MRWRRWLVVATVAGVAAIGATLGIRALLSTTSPLAPTCRVGARDTALVLYPDQASNATTIAGVAKRMGLPDHAVTVALATALQESKLNNYPFGDRDSLGLFQQRPSQGWGTPTQLLTPSYAAEAFFDHLAAVPGWQRLPVAAAAQEVQHSADGAGYGLWEEQAGAIARVLTGEVTPGLTCSFPEAGGRRAAALRELAERELGPGVLDGGDLGGQPSAAADWTVAQWLVAHARSYGVASVSVRGRTWTPDSDEWAPDASASTTPSYTFAEREP